MLEPKKVFRLMGLALVFGALGMASCQKRSGGTNKPDPAPPPTGDDAKPNDQAPAEDPPPDPATPKYGLTVQPSLESVQKDLVDVYCLSCHSGKTPRAKLDLTDLTQFLPSSELTHDPNGYHGRLCAPGKPLDSMLYLVLKSRQKDQMPPATSGIPVVTPEQLKAVETWINSLQASDDGGGDDEPGTDDGGGGDEPGTDDGGGDYEPGD